LETFNMKIFLALITSLALASTSFAGKQNQNKGKKKKSAQQAAQHHAAPGAGGVYPAGAQHAQHVPHARYNTNAVSGAPFKHKTVTQTQINKFQARQLTFSNHPNAQIANVKFHAGHVIQGSQHWQGAHYVAFRNYRAVWHDRGWWHGHHDRIVFVFGAPYYWDTGWWYPAWGYDPGAAYAYDGPIYGYNDLPPDQVVGNVQSALQEQGYYTGEVDGLLGPLTRAAIARYQEDHGLYTTSAIDEPTLESLGMS
jgi:Putative peptidoglycan binding domain